MPRPHVLAHAAAVLLLAVLGVLALPALATDGAAAQAAAPAPAALGAERALTPSDAPEHHPTDCRTRRGARHQVSTPVPADGGQQACVCCSGRPGVARDVLPLTGSLTVPWWKAGRIPLLHQVCRC